ncbi:hypothetical protein PHYBOEH_009933 [Phytophthora boehmeriae]|uniref:Uncharacterized protein n=1 Tax=Phytophthora boehmeriae TaxID=109152 RepID=A0A8T1VQK2_9STRA|nr:hypothetical protein PHYBOEH_009933 [Phytophthora boehmeriae]
MDDLKRGPLSEAAPGKESVDDIFAEFEEPNDYVFDPTTGGYVATKAPPHTAVPPQRTPVALSTTRAVTVTEVSEEAEVGDEVADIIVDKISSLEGELAALKQLIRNRKASYEALFQTGTKTKGSSEDEKSDDDADLAAKRPKTRAIKPRRRSSRKSSEFVSAGRESDSAPELSSLNGRRSKRVIKHKKRGNKADDDDMHFEIESEGLPKAVLPPSITTPTKQISVTEEDDPIDALFDSSNDRDVSRLYGGDDNMGTKEDKNELPISPIALVSKNRSGRTGKSLISTPNSDKESVTTSTSFAKMEFVATVTPDAATSAFGSRGVNDGDEDDNFSINWKRMRSTKLRRRGSQRSSTPSNLVGATPDAIDKSKELLLDPTLLDTRSTSIDASGDALGIPAEKDYASPTLMPVNKFVEGTVSFDRVSDGASVLSLDSNKHPELPSDRSSIEEKTSEEQDAVSLVTLDTILKVEETTPIVDTSNTLLADDKDYSDGEPRVLSVDSVKMRPHTADIPNVTDPTFDIFDMSTDMDFVSMAIPSVINTSTYEEETEDDGNDSNTEAVQGGGSDHSNAEPFSFEIKGPKKRVSDLEMPTSIRRAAFGPDGSDSSPLSPSSSAGDDNVAFGKYATSSVLSSRTPLIDGSVDDQEEVLASTSANTAVLGEVESQEFDTDWQRMQAKEKERKKKLQIKQRQAQRDKVLRKQGVSSKALSGDSTPHSLSRSKSKSGKKKKKDQGESSSQHKKSGRSSRKHRHREKGDSGHTDPPRSLTEL